MKSRKHAKDSASADQPGFATPKSAISYLTRNAIQLTSDSAQLYKSCDRRECRLGKTCMTGEGTGKGNAICTHHWTDSNIRYFQGALDSSFINLCPPEPEGAEPNSSELVPLVIFVPRSLILNTFDPEAIFNAALTSSLYSPCSPKVPAAADSRPSATVQMKSRPASG
jgi:hypothetical protein